MTHPDSAPVSYRSTVIACYLGNFVQAAVVNLTPILFIPLREQFGLSFEQLGFLVLINFVTQVACDLAFSTQVDKHGFRPFAVVAHALTIVGFGLFALAPVLFARPYVGFVIATIVFSGAGGLLELLLSPIVNAIPTPEKASAMSVLHSFYAWGQLTVVLLTTLFLWVFGKETWQWIIALWAILPAVNFILFLRVPLAPPVPEEHRQGVRVLLFKPFFLVAFLTIAFGGAAECAMAQWASAFMEKAVKLPKVVGDTAGVCLFALMLGVGRALNGLYGHKFNLNRIMFLGSGLAVVAYLLVAACPVNVVSLAACALCGLAVSLLWPGTLVLTSQRYPLAGAWMFAFLAAGGDIGAAGGPWLVSVAAEQLPRIAGLARWAGGLGFDAEQLGLRAGMLLATLFPLGALVCLKWLAKSRPASPTHPHAEQPAPAREEPATSCTR